MLLAPPIVKTEAVTNISLAFDVVPFKEEFVEAVDFEAGGGEVLDPMPFWVDLVNAEYYNGGEVVF